MKELKNYNEKRIDFLLKTLEVFAGKTIHLKNKFGEEKSGRLEFNGLTFLLFQNEQITENFIPEEIGQSFVGADAYLFITLK